MGIEPTSEAWEASIKLHKRSNWRHFDVFRVSQMDSNWSSGRKNRNWQRRVEVERVSLFLSL